MSILALTPCLANCSVGTREVAPMVKREMLVKTPQLLAKVPERKWGDKCRLPSDEGSVAS